MTDPILIKARELFIASRHWGRVLETAARNGFYDSGSYIQQHMDEAARAVLRERKEEDASE